jgi:hypothetical protein
MIMATDMIEKRLSYAVMLPGRPLITSESLLHLSGAFAFG